MRLRISAPSAGLTSMFAVPSLDRRVHLPELMDDPSAEREEFQRALLELRLVNLLLGGYRSLRKRLLPFLRTRVGTSVRILDLGTGLADCPERMLRWGTALGVDMHITAVDANPAAVDQARQYLGERLPHALRAKVRVLQGDVRRLPFADDAFDVVTASLFLHHFSDPECEGVLREMSRIASEGIVVNDLHRHTAAYLGIRGLAATLPVSRMFAHDGPLSVRRAFRPEELRRMAHAAGLERIRIARGWAFRLHLSTLP